MNRAPKPELSQSYSWVHGEPSTVHGKERLISLGRLVNTYGVGGHVRLLPHHFPCPSLQNAVTVFLQPKGMAPVAYQIKKAQPHKPFILLKLKGIDSIEEARTLVGLTLAVKEQDLPPLAEGEFYHYQIIGMEVITTSGTVLGTIKEIFFTGSHDVWVVRQGQREHLIPVIDEVIRSLEISSKKAIIEPQEGLLG
jgi:16S rRNA processing protein RimM